jgi:N-acetylglucosaminyldiphosphoundecaprenol N-acetyl-beta-D-mannosaminyltransferase
VTMSSNIQKVRIIGSEFFNVDRLTACDIIETELQKKERFIYVAVKDVSLSVRSLEDLFLRHFYEKSDFIFVDGKGLLYASWLLGKPLKGMVGGPGLYNELLKRSHDKGYRIFLLGGTEDTLVKAVRHIKERLPKANIVGWNHGYFNLEESKRIVDNINSKNTEILFIGISTPKREQFIAGMKDHFNNMLCLPVGGVFDNEAGKTKYAPKLIAVLGLEWLYRSIQEPDRLMKRYLKTHSKFLWYFIKELIKTG